MSAARTLLGLLEPQPSYGYTLKQRYDQLFAPRELRFGQVYATLGRFERDGLATEATAAPNLLVVDEDYSGYGMSAEVIASISEELGPTGPRMRRHATDVSVPASAALEAKVVPSAESIAGAARAMLN
jgi:hypothetical protein